MVAATGYRKGAAVVDGGGGVGVGFVGGEWPLEIGTADSSAGEVRRGERRVMLLCCYCLWSGEAEAMGKGRCKVR